VLRCRSDGAALRSAVSPGSSPWSAAGHRGEGSGGTASRDRGLAQADWRKRIPRRALLRRAHGQHASGAGGVGGRGLAAAVVSVASPAQAVAIADGTLSPPPHPYSLRTRHAGSVWI